MESYKYEKLDFSDMFLKKYKEFTPILNEYFSRMKVDLNLGDEQIYNKINLLIQNVDSISFGIVPKKYKGCFIPERHKILLNVNMFNYMKDFELLFNIITHELDHATNYDKKNKKFGMYRYNKKIGNYFNPHDELLDEIRTDIGSTRRVYNDNYTDDKKMIRKTAGYKNFTMFSTMLQNCLGITEKEFVQSSIDGRVNFDNKMKNKFSNPKDYFKFMERFTIDTSILMNFDTANRNLILENKNIFNNTFKDLKKLSYIGLNLKLEKDILENKDMDFNLEEYLKNIRYSIEENSKNFEFAATEFSIIERLSKTLHMLSNHNFQDLLNFQETRNNEKNSKAQNVLESKILYLEMLLENKEKLGDKYGNAMEKVISIKEISKLKIYSKDELKLDFRDNKEIEFKKQLDPKTVMERKKEKENTFNWDNSEVIANIKHAFNINKYKPINIVLSKIIKEKDEDQFLELDTPNTTVANSFKKGIDSLTKSSDEISDLDKKEISETNNLNKNTVYDYYKDK